MNKLDKYIESIYENVEGSPEEINALKSEMKEHLKLTIDEIKATGKTEEESIKIALERFGNNKQIKNELKSIFNKKHYGITGILIAIIVFFTISITLLISTLIGQNYLSQSYNNSGQAEYDYLISHIQDSIKNDKNINKDNLDNIIKERSKHLNGINTRLKSIYIFLLPQNISYNDFISNINYNNTDYCYKGEFYNQNYYFKTFSQMFKSGSNTCYIEIRMNETFDKNFDDMVNFTVLITKCMYISIIIYWILFGIWASIKAYGYGRLNIIWIVMFFMLNIIAYVLFKLTGKLNNKVLSNTV
ncbi:MAG: permease prefix domain 1-containing protein [Bacillota bacterium]|nr:permease prefix domain 1-containing protein [Bacillota bacterium]